MILAVTGHRPQKLGGFSDTNLCKLKEFAEKTLEYMNTQYKISYVITGMALGWDMAVAEACLELNIPYEAYIPCLGQDSKWTDDSRELYKHLIEYAYNIVQVTNQPFTYSCMQERNIAMVKDCDRLLALWDGSPGGTANCVAYAKKIGRSITTCWNSWVKFNELYSSRPT